MWSFPSIAKRGWFRKTADVCNSRHIVLHYPAFGRRGNERKINLVVPAPLVDVAIICNEFDSYARSTSLADA